MWEKVKNFLRNHKKALLIGGSAVIAALIGILVYRFKLSNTEALEAIAEVTDEVKADQIVETISEI